MTHPEDRLADYVDGTLDPRDRTVVDAHLATCRRCREEVAASTAARTALASLPQIAPPPGIASAALEEAGATRVRRGVRRPAGAQRWYRFAAVAVAVAAALLVVTLVLPHVGGGGAERATDRAAGGAAALPTAGPAFAAALEIQDTDYDQASLTSLVASFGAAQAPASPGPLETAQASPKAGTPQQTQQALACVARGVPAEHGSLVRLIQARFEGKPAYIAVFLESPGAGQPADSAAVWVLAAKGCTILSSGYTRL